MAVPAHGPHTARTTVAEAVYRALRRDVITLRHPPGAALTEQQLAQRYGSSRVPVREACRRLQQEDLLTAVPYKGYFVNRISLREIGDCFDLRLVLETHAVERACERATPRALDVLGQEARMEYVPHDFDSYVEFLEHNLEFHLLVAGLAGNRRLASTLRDLLWSMQRFFFLGLDLGDYAAEMRAEHEELLEHLHARDVAEAVACVRRQIERSRDRIQRAVLDGRIDLSVA
jgi:DNA-binding GntR family transcriptional regulator